MRIDLHVHTELCGHATGTAAEMVDAARASGLGVLAITDHLPLPEGYNPAYAMTRSQLGGYVADVQALAEQGRANGGPEVLLGIEADWIPGREDELREELAAHPFDIVLGSVHFLEGWAFDDPDLIAEWDRRDVTEVWRAYFEQVERAAASGLFDVMAHPDLVKKFGHVPEGGLNELYESVADVLAAAGVAVEVSTAGLRKPVGEIYPSLELLKAFSRRGVPATIGSDAHVPEEVGFRLDAAEELLRAAGYRSAVVFRGREMEEIGLGEECR